MDLSAKPFLELGEKLELKKCNLAAHYGVDPNRITPEFVKTFDREKPRSVWYNAFKALPSDMKLHDGIVDWRSKSAQEIVNRIDLMSWTTILTVLLFAPYPQPLSGPQTRSNKSPCSVYKKCT